MEKKRYYIATGLADELKRQGRYQRWLARQVGVHEVTLSLAVNRHRPVPEKLARRIATVLDAPFSSLFDLTNVSNIDTHESEAA